MKYDIVIKDGLVVDTKNDELVSLNIGIKNGMITALSKEQLSSDNVIYATDLIVSPGFVDIHCHEDSLSNSFIKNPIPDVTAEAALKCGNTTIISGNCGFSAHSIKEYYRNVSRKKIDCYTLVGNVTLRQLLGINNYTPATDEQIRKMCDMARNGVKEGAIGISFGLQYAPGTSEKEIMALCTIAKEMNVYTAFHMRYDIPSKAVEAVQEIISIGKATGVKIQISHLAANIYGEDNIKHIASMINKANQSGCDISADMYPYNVWSTGIKSAVFDNGFEDFNFSYHDVEIVSGELAGSFCNENLFKELRQAETETLVACHNAMPIEDVIECYKLPFVMVGSDGSLKLDDGVIKGHPRGAGTSARFISCFVNENKALSIENAIKKLTILPAMRANFKNIGCIEVGYKADIVIFDSLKIQDKARFGIGVCGLPPVGIKHVIKDGKIVI